MRDTFMILCLASWSFALTTAATVPLTLEVEEKADHGTVHNEGFNGSVDYDVPIVGAADGEEANNGQPGNGVADSFILSSLNSLSLQNSEPNSNHLNDVNYFPYEGVRQDTFAVPEPNLGVSINSRALLAPPVEFLHIAEDFITLSGDVIRRIYALFVNNYALIRGFCNILFSKLTQLQNFSVAALGVLRSVLEFVLQLFSNLSITLPSITFGSVEPAFAPHEIYGVPPTNSTNAFQSN